MMGTLADALKSAGHTKIQPSQYDIFSVSDDAIDFPEERLGQGRTRHENRLVIILQNNKDNHDPTIKICTIAPLSTRKHFYRFDYLLKKLPNHTFLKSDSFIRIGHVQPILKKDLKTRFGSVLTQSIRDDIKDRLFLLYDL
jgi:mRNA-degrading endonuclease toxin of MazEF toxin-antitoxin module